METESDTTVKTLPRTQPEEDLWIEKNDPQVVSAEIALLRQKA